MTPRYRLPAQREDEAAGKLAAEHELEAGLGRGTPPAAVEREAVLEQER